MRHRNRYLVPALGAALFSAACTVDQAQEGKLPDVDVSGGQLPKLDVDLPKVRVGTDTHRVVVPDVDVKPKETLP